MADKLKIYACSGIGETGESRIFDYWTDNTQTVSNTQAVNTLLALINMRVAEVGSLSLTRDEQAECLNDIDLYAISLYYAQAYSGNVEKIRSAGRVIGGMAANGLFRYNSTDNAERDQHLDDLFAKAEQLMEAGASAEPTKQFAYWWRTTVEERDKVGLTPEQQQAVKDALKGAISGIGEVDEAWKQNPDLANYLTNAGRYFTYTYFTDAQLAKLPKVFTIKKLRQQKVYNYCEALFVDVYGSKQEMRDIVYTGMCAYYKDTPEHICAQVASGARPVNSLSVALATIISAAITAVVSLIVAIISACSQAKVIRYQALNQEAVEAGAAHESDFNGLEFEGTSGKPLLWIAAAVAGLWLMFKK